MYRKCKAGSTTKERFLEARKEMKEMQLRKQQEKRKEERVNLRKIKREAEVWDFINKKIKKKKWKGNKI